MAPVANRAAAASWRGRAAGPDGRQADGGHRAAPWPRGLPSPVPGRCPGEGRPPARASLERLREADRGDELIAQQIREVGCGRQLLAGNRRDEPPAGRRERHVGEHAAQRRDPVGHGRGVQRVRHVEDVRLDPLFRGPPRRVVHRVRRAAQDMAARPVMRRDDQLAARFQGESGVRVGGQADQGGAAGAWRGEHGGALRHEPGRVGLGQAARPDQAGDLAHAVPEGGRGPHPQGVQPAQRGQRCPDNRRLGPGRRPVLPGGCGGRLAGKQQDHPPGRAVRGKQPGTRGQWPAARPGSRPVASG